MAVIQKLAKLAHHTFQQLNSVDGKVFTDNMTKLLTAANSVRKSDVGLIPEYLTQNSVWVKSCGEAPVTYIDIFRNDFFTMGIFIVRQGARIPLHDHPGMYGVIKVLHGQLSVQSYTRTEQLGNPKKFGKPFPVTKHASVLVGEDDAAGVLTPKDLNLHEVKAEGGIAAFLDVLAPPYDSAHDCHYYREVVAKNVDNTSPHYQLVEIDPPATYWSDTQPYLGPIVQPTEFLSRGDITTFE